MNSADQILAGYDALRADQEALCKDLHRHPELSHAVLTVGSLQAGTRSNVIPDHAVLELNMRSYSQQTRQHMLTAIQRIVRAECQASDSPEDPEFETIMSFPVTDNDEATTARVATAFAKQFGDDALEIDRQTVSEDFSKIPDSAGVPYTYWAIGFTDPDTYRAAEKAGRLGDLTTNHSPKFLPPLQPTLRTGTGALTTAALAWLAPPVRTGGGPHRGGRPDRTEIGSRNAHPKAADDPARGRRGGSPGRGRGYRLHGHGLVSAVPARGR